jgi:hypothetical protein
MATRAHPTGVSKSNHSAVGLIPLRHSDKTSRITAARLGSASATRTDPSTNSATRSTKYITLKLAAQTYPIRLASDDVKEPTSGHYGFEWYDASGAPPTVVDVRFVDRDTLRIELSATPTGSSKLLQYAHTPDATQAAGPAITGRRGTIHDSTSDEPNYLNSFSIAAP